MNDGVEMSVRIISVHRLREVRRKEDKVHIRPIDKSVVQKPLILDPEAWLAELKNVPADPDFMKERNQPKTPKRKIFK